MFDKVLVAIDNSDMGRHVFTEAIAIAKKLDASVMILHVLDPFDDRYTKIMSLQTNSIYPTFHPEAVSYYMGEWETFKQEGLAFLSGLCTEAIANGITAEFTQNFGEPGHIICEAAQNYGADLIIVGRRGRKGLSELLLGSVSNYVLHHASCSVLTIQGPYPTANTQENTSVAEPATTV